MERPTNKQIEEVLAGIATVEDAKLVARWFATEEGSLYLKASMTRDTEVFKPELADIYISHAIPSEEIFTQIQRNIHRKRLRRVCFRVAAILIPVLFLIGLYVQLDSRVELFGATEYEEVIVAKGEKMQMMFQDGTRVFINSGSKLKYPKKFALQSREVYLEGEAYFAVAKNKYRPFIVHLDGPSVHVKGTSFNVQDYPDNDNIEICLDEGRVNLTLPSEKKFDVHPGERLIYNKESARCTILKMSDLSRMSKWKHNVIVFKDTSLAEVIKILNRWYGVEFKVEDQRALNYMYTLTSENALLEKVLADLEKIAPVRFEYNDSEKEVIVKMGK